MTRKATAVLLILLAAILAGLAWPVAWVALRLRRQAARLRGEVCPWEDGTPKASGPCSLLLPAGMIATVLDAHERDVQAGRARVH